MADKLSRLEQDRALFMRGNRQQLVELIKQANPHLVAKAISSAIEMQIVTEEIAREKGIEINDGTIGEYKSSNGEFLEKQVNLAVNSLICSIVSQEG